MAMGEIKVTAGVSVRNRLTPNNHLRRRNPKKTLSRSRFFLSGLAAMGAAACKCFERRCHVARNALKVGILTKKILDQRLGILRWLRPKDKSATNP